MKTFVITLFLLIFGLPSMANDIYIDQIGDTLNLDIVQDGANNEFGDASTDSDEGNKVNITIDGNGNSAGHTVDLNITGGGSTYDVTQSGVNDNTVSATFSGDTQDVDITQSD